MALASAGPYANLHLVQVDNYVSFDTVGWAAERAFSL